VDHREVLAVRIDVDRLDDRDEAADVGGRLGQDHGVGGLVGRHRRVLRDERLERVHDRLGVDVLERDEPRDVEVPVDRRPGREVRRDARLLGIANGDHLEGTAGRRHGREALHLEHRFEDGVGLVDRDARGRDDGHPAPHAVVVDEVLAGELGDRVDHDAELGVVEIELHELAARGGGGRVASLGRGGAGRPDRGDEEGRREGRRGEAGSAGASDHARNPPVGS